MGTTLVINEHLLEEVRTLSGAKTKKEAVEKAMKISPEPFSPRPPTLPTPNAILAAILFN